MRGPTTLAAVIVALAMGCGSGGGGSDPDAGPDDDPDAGGDPTALDCARKSGSRIRQVERVHSDDSDELLRMYDNELMVPCAFGASEDGSLRCLPVADGAPFAAGQVFYEAGCTNRIARLDDPLGPDPPDYMRHLLESEDGCQLLTGYVELGNQLSVAPDATVYTGSPEACVGQVAGTNPYFQITADLTPEDLVEGTPSWTSSGRIQQQQIDGADGSRVCVEALIDQDLEDHPCAIGAGEDGVQRCLPLATGVEAAFSDNGCTEAVTFAVLDSTCGSPFRYTTESTGGDCPKLRVRAFIEELDAVYAGDPKTCTALALQENQTLFRQGPAVSGTSFSAFEPAFFAPGARLERIDLDNDAGLRKSTPQSLWRDPMFDDAWCRFRVAGDGLERCVPFDADVSPVAAVATLYTAIDCATPVLVGVPDLTCGREQPKYATTPGEDGLLVYESMGPHPGPLFENPGACAQVADPSLYTQLSAEIPAAMFVSGTEMIE